MVSKGAFMSYRILIVEDNEKNLKLIADILTYHGYEIIEAGDGATGVKLAGEQKPDLILMDIQMPVMDGMAAIAILRDDPETRGIKVIALTSFAMKGDKERFMKAGFADYIAKPIDTRQLPEIVKKHLVGNAQ
jgi:CheY-like chemotaxis protein